MTAAFDEPDAAALEAGQRAALRAALRGVRGANPLVGAALLDESGRILHVGFHRGAGTPHAEVDVLSQARAAGTDLSRTTLCVTLEPCSHTGRTGPCAQAVLDAGIPRVRYGQADPTALASGGAAMLRAAGTDVRGGLLEQECRHLNDRWTAARRQRRPFVTAKIAATLDGYVAAADGSSQWITGEASRNHGHGLRRRADAILVGTGTALADDPSLTAREPDGTLSARQPRRVVLGLSELPAEARLHQDPGFLPLRTRNPHDALAQLDDAGIGHVLVEGGPRVLQAFLRAGLVDEIYWYTAPILLGAGAPAVRDLGIGSLDGALRWAQDPAGAHDPVDPARPDAASLDDAPTGPVPSGPDSSGPVRLGEDSLLHLRPATGHAADPSSRSTGRRGSGSADGAATRP